jgi:hypothetical protein
MSSRSIGKPLSGINNLGLIPITVTQHTVSTPGTIIHKSSFNSDDYVWVWAANTHTQAVTITVYKGSISEGFDVDNIMTLQPRDNKILIEPGILLKDGLEIRIVASVAEVVKASGFVHRRTEGDFI